MTELTRNQALVFDALSKSHAPLSAYSLLDQLRDHGFRAPLQVYRALEKLQEAGLVHRLESLNAFVACAHKHDDHDGHCHGLVAFAICDKCGQVTEFSDKEIEARLTGWADRSGFRAEKTTMEIRGHCALCA
ncbi:MAG: transcriptional repressor [Rhizobiaceae bacterium]|nr:transcriptional repressor [Rhizobiaceae bacterium]